MLELYTANTIFKSRVNIHVQNTLKLVVVVVRANWRLAVGGNLQVNADFCTLSYV
jgi:hypothetical protein